MNYQLCLNYCDKFSQNNTLKINYSPLQPFYTEISQLRLKQSEAIQSITEMNVRLSNEIADISLTPGPQVCSQSRLWIEPLEHYLTFLVSKRFLSSCSSFAMMQIRQTRF